MKAYAEMKAEKRATARAETKKENAGDSSAKNKRTAPIMRMNFRNILMQEYVKDFGFAA